MGQVQTRTIHWLKIGLIFFGFFAASMGLGYLIQSLFTHYRIPLDIPIWAALLIIFGILIVMNLSVLPLPFGISLILVASQHWNPALVALAGSLGASIGETSSYFIGRLGKKIAVNEDTPGFRIVNSWIRKYGIWAIIFLSFQPIIPFELGGFVAGLVKMPARNFLPAICIGKYPKYLILVYLGDIIMSHFHLFH